MMQRRQPVAPMGPDIAPMAAPPPMEFAPVPQQQAGAPDLSPLMAAITQRMSQSAQMGSSKAVDAPMRKKPAFDGMMDQAAGGYANA